MGTAFLNITSRNVKDCFGVFERVAILVTLVESQLMLLAFCPKILEGMNGMNGTLSFYEWRQSGGDTQTVKPYPA